MHKFVLFTLLLGCTSSWGMTQCPPGTRSGFMWRCVGIPVEEAIGNIARYTSVESACSIVNPAQSADYAARLKYLLSTLDLWPGEKLRERPDYSAMLENANQRTRAFDSSALRRQCDRFVDVNR